MAASPAAKGEEVRTEAGLRIVEAPLPVVPCPVAETEALVSLCVEVILAKGETWQTAPASVRPEGVSLSGWPD